MMMMMMIIIVADSALRWYASQCLLSNYEDDVKYLKYARTLFNDAKSRQRVRFDVLVLTWQLAVSLLLQYE